MRHGYRKLLNYVHRIEDKHGTVILMDNRERNYMLKLSNTCYKDEQANLNQYEVTIINKYLNGDINVRQLAYYLGGITDEKASRKAELYKVGRYELTQHRNYWER